MSQYGLEGFDQDKRPGMCSDVATWGDGGHKRPYTVIWSAMLRPKVLVHDCLHQEHCQQSVRMFARPLFGVLLALQRSHLISRKLPYRHC